MGTCLLFTRHIQDLSARLQNNEIIYSSDTISIDITNKKDFLAFNWKDVTDSDFTTGYANNLDGYYLSTQTHIHQGVPSVMLYAKMRNMKRGIYEKQTNTV